MKKTLSTLRVDERILTHMKKAIEKYNANSMFPITEAEFRRMSIELLSQFIIQDKPLPFKVTL